MPPRVEITPRAPVRALRPIEAWYLECFTRLAEHMGRPPTAAELGAKIDRTSTPVYRMLAHLEGLGYLARDVAGKFHVRPAS